MALAQRRIDFLHRHLYVRTLHASNNLPKKPAAVKASTFQLAARTPGLDIHDAVLLQALILMSVPADHIAHAVFLDELMEGKLTALEHHRNQPKRLMKKHELGIAVLVRSQIASKECHLFFAQVLGLAIIENCKMRALVIEAVRRGTSGLLFEDLARCGRPNVVVARGEILRTLVLVPDGMQCAPLSFPRGIIAALYCIAHVDDEARRER